MSKELKGCGVPAEGKCRWVMRNGDGTEWETKAHYHKHEVEEWECSVPVKPILEELK
jgi:hypothetical protein